MKIIDIIIASTLSILSIFFAALFVGILTSLFDGSRIFYDAVLGFGVIASIYGIAILFFWGLPLHTILYFFQIYSPFVYVPIGSLGGPILLLIFRPFGIDPMNVTLVQMLVLYGFGMVASFIFWVFATKDRRYRK